MKKLFYFVCVFSVALLISCSSNPSKKIIGTWKCNNAEFENLEETINKALASVPDSLKEIQKKYMTDNIKNMTEEMKHVSMNFKEDKTFESIDDGKSDKGTWSISEDGKTLTTKGDGEGKEAKLNIEELSSSKLVLSIEDEGSKIKLSFQK